MHDLAAPAVLVRDVTRSFGPVVAVNGFHLDLHPGEVVGLLGHNGAGKTTLIRLVNGLLRPDAGSIEVFGMDPTTQGARVRARTGVLTTYPALEEWLTPVENLRTHAAVHGVSPDVAEPRMRSLLARFTIDPDDTAPCRGLSAGQKQRVALARALVHDPDLLLLDEPTANLDPLAARDVREAIRELADEHARTVLMSTHNLVEAQTTCDRVAIMREGSLLAVGTPDELARGLGLGKGVVVVEVGPGQVDTALAALPGAEVVAPRVVHVPPAPGDTADDAAPEVVRRLVDAGVEVHGIQSRAATLEDVYVDLHADLPPLEPVRRADVKGGPR